jgi:hypothetical protein
MGMDEVLTIETSNVVIEALQDLCVQIHILLPFLFILFNPK